MNDNTDDSDGSLSAGKEPSASHKLPTIEVGHSQSDVPAPSSTTSQIGSPHASPQIVEDFIATPEREKLLQDLCVLLRDGDGLAVVQGRDGSGKSVLANVLLHKLCDLPELACIELEGDISTHDILLSVAASFGLSVDINQKSGALLVAIRRFIQNLIDQENSAVLIIDNAQYLNQQSLGVLLSLLQKGQVLGAGLSMVFFSTYGLIDYIDALEIPEIAVYDYDVPRLTEKQLVVLLRDLKSDNCNYRVSVSDDRLEEIAATSDGLPARALAKLLQCQPSESSSNSAQNASAVTAEPVNVAANNISDIDDPFDTAISSDHNDELDGNRDQAPIPHRADCKRVRRFMPLAHGLALALLTWLLWWAFTGNTSREADDARDHVASPEQGSNVEISDDSTQLKTPKVPDPVKALYLDSDKPSNASQQPSVGQGRVLDNRQALQDSDAVADTAVLVDETARPGSAQADDASAELADRLAGVKTLGVETLKTPPRKTLPTEPSPTEPSPTKATPPAKVQPVKRQSVAGLDVAEKPVKSLDTPRWLSADQSHLLSLKPGSYTLQVLASSQHMAVRQYMLRQQNSESLFAYHSMRKGRSRYVVVVGTYPSREAAIDAIASLPKVQRDEKPWPRKLIDIQLEIKAAK